MMFFHKFMNAAFPICVVNFKMDGKYINRFTSAHIKSYSAMRNSFPPILWINVFDFKCGTKIYPIKILSVADHWLHLYAG